ncbi:MAG: aminotransferase class V-fold PLP-dependent enzyme [Tepidisphaerales bacterium]
MLPAHDAAFGSRLVGNADAFPILRSWRFFNHAGVCPLPAVAADALRRYADEASGSAYLEARWHRDIARLRGVLAGLIGAQADEIALVKNTSEGLATVALGLEWSPGDRIVTTGIEYSSNMYPWMDVSRRLGVELAVVPARQRDDGAVVVSEDELLAELDKPRTRLLTVSHVQFATGQRMDIERLGEACRRRGVLFCVDAIQSVGILPVDVGRAGVDFLAADGHKWLLGPEGAGFLFVRKAVMDQLRPLELGWASVHRPFAFGTYDLTLKPDASRYECGSLTVPAFLSLLASAELLAGVGIDFIARRLRELGDHLTDGLRDKGYTVVSPREDDRWSGSVCFIRQGLDVAAEAQRLRQDHRIEIVAREGRLRASPHFYNTADELDRLLDVLA